MLHEESRSYLVKEYERNPCEQQAERLAETFDISVRRVYQLVSEYRKTGTVKERIHERGRKAKINPEQVASIDSMIQNGPDITLQELHDQLGLECGISTLDNVVTKKLGYTRKKKMIHASEQERPRCAGKTKKMGSICKNG